MGKASKQASEIDIVAIGNEEKNLILGECKYTKKEKGLELLHTLQEKTPAIVSLTGAKNIQYIIFSTAALCDLLSIKYDLGKRTREAYKNKNGDTMSALIEDYKKAEAYLDVFYDAFRKLWFTENKAHGFEVQDIRLGGLKQRLAHCRSRLTEYAEGKIENIPELEEGVLDYFGNGKEYSEETGAACLSWWRSALVQLM